MSSAIHSPTVFPALGRELTHLSFVTTARVTLRAVKAKLASGSKVRNGTLAIGSSADKSATALAKSPAGTTVRVGPISLQLLQRL